MFVFNVNVKGLASDQFKSLQESINQLTQKVNTIMSAQDDAAVQLNAIAAQAAIDSANLTEALAELSGFPGQVTTLQASVDALTAELAAAGAGSVSPALQAAIDAVVSSVAPVTASAAQLAAIVPNPVV
jgi:phage-related protein